MCDDLSILTAEYFCLLLTRSVTDSGLQPWIRVVSRIILMVVMFPWNVILLVHVSCWLRWIEEVDDDDNDDDIIEEVDDDDINNNKNYQRVAPFPSLSIKLVSHLQGLSNKNISHPKLLVRFFSSVVVNKTNMKMIFNKNLVPYFLNVIILSLPVDRGPP